MMLSGTAVRMHDSWLIVDNQVVQELKDARTPPVLSGCLWVHMMQPPRTGLESRWVAGFLDIPQTLDMVFSGQGFDGH